MSRPELVDRGEVTRVAREPTLGAFDRARVDSHLMSATPIVRHDRLRYVGVHHMFQEAGLRESGLYVDQHRQSFVGNIG